MTNTQWDRIHSQPPSPRSLVTSDFKDLKSLRWDLDRKIEGLNEHLNIYYREKYRKKYEKTKVDKCTQTSP